MESKTSLTVQIIANPLSGSFSLGHLAALQHAFERRALRVSLAYGVADNGTAEDVDLICVMGGDGTVRDVITALDRARCTVPVCAYPSGTINLLARETLYSRDPDVFVDRVLSLTARRTGYAGCIGDGLFLVCASVGPDSRAIANISLRLKARIGRAAYAVALLRVFLRWERPAITLDVDGETIACEAFYIAKGRFFAGPWSFAPEAAIGDPELHLVALSRARRRDYLRFLFALLRGRAVEALPGIICRRFTRLSAISGTPIPIQADGDIVAMLPAAIALCERPITYA